MSQLAKLLLMVVSFVLSLILWVYVQLQESPPQPLKKSYNVQVVSLKGLPDSLLAVEPPEKVTVFPRGPVEERRLIDEKDLTAVIDLSKATPETQEYPVQIVNTGDYQVQWNNPTAIVKVEKKATAYKEVHVADIGQLQNRNYLYLPETTYTEPGKVLITGPESDVKSVVSAYVELDLSTVQQSGETIDAPVILRVFGSASAPSTVTVEPTRVKIHPAIVAGAAARTLHVTPSFRGLAPPGYEVKSYEVIPDNVEVRGSAESLSGMQFLKTQSIELGGLKETKTFIAVPTLPSEVVLSNPQLQIRVKVVIEAVAPVVPTKPPPEVKKRAHRRRSGG